MKYYLAILCSVSILHAENNADIKTPLLDGYAVSFSDEFEAEALDSSKWKLGINSGNAIQASQESAYAAKNIRQSNGVLYLTAVKEAEPIESRVYGGKKKAYQYSSGGINTDGTYHLQGEFYVEIRCKFPQNPGGYVAFWTMPSKIATANGMHPKNMHETDFFEFKTNLAKASHYRYFSSLWWHSLTAEEAGGAAEGVVSKKGENHFWIIDQKNKLNTHLQMKKPSVDFAKWVTFGFKARKGLISWHLVQDGSAYNAPSYFTYRGQNVQGRIDPKTNESHFNVFRPVPEFNNYLILNYRVSDKVWLGGPIDDSQLPSTFLVDYLRVYQKL